MNNVMKNWRARTLTAAATLACAFAVLLSVNGTSAKAASYHWTAYLAPQQQWAINSELNYRSTQVWGSDWVAAGAHWPGGWNLYASYAVGFTYACHPYQGYQELGGIMQNASLYVSQSMAMTELYGGATNPAC